MHSRQDYLDHKCTHREYYAQFVTPEIVSLVEHRIGRMDILTSRDEHFNDIPLNRWDNLQWEITCHIDGPLRKAGDFPTLSGCVCTAKEAARQIAERAKQERTRHEHTQP